MHHVAVSQDNKDVLYEKMYYEECDIVLYLEKGLEEKTLSGQTGISMIQRPGGYDGVYLEQQINRILGAVAGYCKMGVSVKGAFSRLAQQDEAKVTLLDMGGNQGKHPLYYEFFKYH